MYKDTAFTALELELLTDENLHETRHRLVARVQTWLAEVETALRPVVETGPWLPGTDVVRGKISRGDNYAFQPYQVLDFPRYAQGQNVMLLRTMVLWSVGVSLEFIGIGQPKQEFVPRLLRGGGVPTRLRSDWALGTSDSPWEWAPIEEHYTPLRAYAPAGWRKVLEESDYLKLALHLPFAEPVPLPTSELIAGAANVLVQELT